MNNDTSYNGWTNYETWRVNLELIDSDYWRERLVDEAGDDPSCVDVYELAAALSSYCEEFLASEGGGSVCFNYAMAFVDNVDFRQIAQRMVEDFIADKEGA